MTRAAMRFTLAFAVWLASAFSPAGATPRYSVTQGAPCGLCHVSPSGGGARTPFGAQQFSHRDLPIEQVPFDELDRVNPQLSDVVQLGFDVRSLYFGGDEPAQNSFFQMQGDLYVSAQLDEDVVVSFDKGLRDDFELSTFLHVLPGGGYVRVGRFTPPYGLRIPDHTALVRERLDMDFDFKETGIELGLSPDRLQVAVSITNGNEQLLDDGEEKAVTGRADYRLELGGLRTLLGVTGRWNGERVGDDDAIGGVYAGLAVGRFSLLAEVARREKTRTSHVSFVELAVVPMRGVTAYTEHHFHDRDLDLASGAENMYVAGVEIVPRGYLAFALNARYREIARAIGPDENVLQGELVLHVFY